MYVMANDVNAFIYQWGCDVRHRLEGELDSLKDQLRDGDEASQAAAADKAFEILSHVRLPLTDEEQNRLAESVIADETLPIEKRREVVGLLLNGKRRKGRPRTEVVQDAISALSMHLAGEEWREIALKLRGCKHPTRTRTKSCHWCGEAVAQSVRRLERFLRKNGYVMPLARPITSDERMALFQTPSSKKS
jgi:hypothetical protein